MRTANVREIHSIDEALSLASALIARASTLIDFGSPLQDTEDRAVTAVRVAEQAKALAADRVAEAHRAGVPRRRSCRSMGVLLGERLSTDSRMVAPYATLGVWLGDFSEFTAAWQHGEITDNHVRLLRGLDSIRTHHLLQRDQELLLGHARVLTWDSFESACRYWLLAADPDGELPTERERSYGTTTRTHANGDVEIRSILDPITGEAALTALEHEDQKLYRQSEDDPGTNPELLRMNSRRRTSIALLNLLTRGFQRVDGTFPTPLIKPNGETAEHSKPHRLFTKNQKQALLVAARGRCQHLGCTSPWITLTTDHKQPSSRGGRTSLANGQILCDACNKHKRDTV